MTILTLLFACSGSTTTLDPVETAETGHTGDTAVALEEPYVFQAGVWLLGTDLCLAGTHLLLSGPTPGGDGDTPVLTLVDPLRDKPGDITGAPQLLTARSAGGSQLGVVTVCPGDVTADGEPEVLAVDRWSVLPERVYLFSGPFVEDQYAEEDAAPIAWPDTERGAACGDVSGDGTDDLCLNTGIALGPVADPITADVTWSGVANPSEIRVAGADLDDNGQRELLVTEPAALAVHRLTTLLPGDLDLATSAATTWTAPALPTVLSADGDLDGDGLDDLVVAWDSAVAVATDLSGGDLAGAHAVLSLPGVQDLATGDVDGDGADDLIVGTVGEVRIYLGPLSAGPLTEADADKLLVGQQHPDDEFGHALLASDLDGDGDAELVVGAPEHTVDTLREGRVYRYMNPMLAP
jgi:hypothetical protein